MGKRSARSKVVMVRMTDGEKVSLKAMAVAAGVSVSDLLMRPVRCDGASDGMEALMIRMSPGDRRQVEYMAKQAGQSVSDFILARVWGEAPPEPAAAPPEKVMVVGPQAERLRAALSIPGVRLGVGSVDLIRDREEPPPLPEPKERPAPKRRFNAHRPQWYNRLDGGDWWEIVEDVMTGQVWLNANGQAREFDSEQAARAHVDASQSA